MDSSDQVTSRDVGSFLEDNVENIFEKAGFSTQRNVRRASYELDVIASFGNRELIVECKNYQNSHLVIRNLIHQWSNKRELLGASSVVLVVYGVHIKESDRKLAKSNEVVLWGEQEVDSFNALLMKPELLQKEVLRSTGITDKKNSLQAINIASKYRWDVELRVFLPLLANEETDYEDLYFFFLEALKMNIRTELRLEETDWELRQNLATVFEDLEDNLQVQREVVDSHKEWVDLAHRISETDLLAKKRKTSCLQYMKQLDAELDAVIEYYTEADHPTITYRLIKARIKDVVLDQEVANLGFTPERSVVIRASSENRIFLELEDIKPQREQDVVDWILTAEHRLINRNVQVGEQTKQVSIAQWVFSSQEEAAEATFRILDEYYGLEEAPLRDWELAEKPTRSHCFIATAAYGTLLAQEINVLRRWRDKELQRRVLGRWFISVYYVLSPPIAHIIKKHEWLRASTRKLLQPLINWLSKE